MKILKVFLLLFLFSCTDEKEAESSFSRSTDTLARFINLSVYKPVNVMWRVVPLGTPSGRMSAPGPTDYVLQAFIQFDRATADKLAAGSKTGDGDVEIVKYRFAWLPDVKVKEEFKTSKVYEPAAFIKSPYLQGNFIFMSPDIILLRLQTQ